MHLTKPVLIAASFLWVTAFASPINSPAILRTRGLIGGSTTDGNTKDIAGNTAAGNTVGDDNTKSLSKSNAVEGAIDSFRLDDFAGSLAPREASKRGHRHGSHEQAGDSDNGVSDGSDDTPNDSANDANDATEGVGFGAGATDAATNAADADTGGVEGLLLARDNDGTVHDANKAVHDANKVIHNALHGLLHGIFL